MLSHICQGDHVLLLSCSCPHRPKLGPLQCRQHCCTTIVTSFVQIGAAHCSRNCHHLICHSLRCSRSSRFHCFHRLRCGERWCGYGRSSGSRAGRSSAHWRRALRGQGGYYGQHQQGNLQRQRGRPFQGHGALLLHHALGDRRCGGRHFFNRKV